MTIRWNDDEFKIAINMAGAVSAGAYTAGVLDFLIEALEEWEKAKIAFRAHLGDTGLPAIEDPVPLHNVSIQAFSGASAGGMCAAIASVMVQRSFDHINDPHAVNTSNTFYEAWVNKIDISNLLATNDLKSGGPVVSLLDSTIIDQIANYALTPAACANPEPPSYIGKQLNLFLTLTNVRGIPYTLYADPSPDLDEFMTYYADRLRFEVTQQAEETSCPQAKPLPLTQSESPRWEFLRSAAKATGAFPLFLAPRVLTRDLSDYEIPGWVPISGPNPDPEVSPAFPDPRPQTLATLNVDGGVTDNDPFDLAHDFLVSQNPKATNGMNPRSPLDANCAVVSVAPFPAADRYNPDYKPEQARGLFTMLARLVTVLISQSRFLGESLNVATAGPVFSRFVISPSEDGKAHGSALQCGAVGAFGGFMERSFRAHDFLLGRRNCQKFLKSYFLLPADNPVIRHGLGEADTYAGQLQAKFAGGPPRDFTGIPQGKVWMPVIPLVGSASREVVEPAPGAINAAAIGKIADAVIQRFAAIKGPLLDGAPAAWLLKLVAGIFCAWPTRIFVRDKIVSALTAALAPNVKTSD